MNQHKSLLQFPCKFNLKIMGHNHEIFEKAVLAIIREQKIRLDEAINTKLSANHKFLSMTVTFTAKSKKQLDKLYQALHDCKEVLMTL
jgi:putative lipoic acid-binding regulatory protein